MRRTLPIVTCLLLSAAMQTAIFPVAGPLPVWRAQMAWIACVPWFLVLISVSCQARRPVLYSALWSYGCGALWYLGHCYWIFQTMHVYGGLSAFMAAVVLLLFCLYLGLYHALFGAVAAVLLRRWVSRIHPMLIAVLLACGWVAVELARARVTSFPWDLLGYSQIDNAALTAIAPSTGVYGVSLIVAITNAAFALWAASLLPPTAMPGNTQKKIVRSAAMQTTLCAALAVAFMSLVAGLLFRAPRPISTQQAIAVQPNLDFAPQPAAPSVPLELQLAKLTVEVDDSSGAPKPNLVLWPEAPTPWEVHEPLLQSTLTGLARSTAATVLVDSNSVDSDPVRPRHARLYNSAALFTASGLQARYDKIHLVPFGEFVPYADLFAFAGGLTQQVGTFDRGIRRAPLVVAGKSYGVFICYESIFPDEVRQLVERGAGVLVNLSDDGWYGDTSAPFQHSNMARMRAIENRRWLLRDTNTGITESIDPYGNVRAVAPRHRRLAVALPYDYQYGQTFYTRHGDIFAWFCAAVTLAALLLSIAGDQATNAAFD